mgnify:CR=1 FL=1
MQSQGVDEQRAQSTSSVIQGVTTALTDYAVIEQVASKVDEDDALVFALAGTAVRDAMYRRFARRRVPGFSSSQRQDQKRFLCRFLTRYVAMTCSTARLRWARELSPRVL